MNASNTKPIPQMVKFFFGKIIPFGMVLVGALALYVGISNVLMARASTTWPSVAGIISKSDVRIHVGSSGDQVGSSSATYHADIEYDYVVDGKKFKGSRITLGDFGTADRADADSICNKYPEGIRVTVYYKPNDYQEALLEPGLRTSTWVPVYFGIPFLLIGLALLVFIPKTNKSTA